MDSKADQIDREPFRRLHYPNTSSAFSRNFQPMHYLILCGVDAVLARLFERVVIPTTVFAELQHPNTPALVQEQLPAWIAVQKPPCGDGSTCRWLERLRQTNARWIRSGHAHS